MRSISCKDIGCKDDNYVSLGETDQEVIDGMFGHIKKNHPRMLEKISDLEKKMRQNIKKVPDQDKQKFGKPEEGIELNGE
jgi:predicted small metal-binding protein